MAAGGKVMKRRKNLVDWVNEYIERRRDLGFRMGVEQGELLRFAQYAEDSGHRGPVSISLALEWIQLSKNGSPAYRARRLAMLRSFAKYLAIYDPKTEIPPTKILGPVGVRREPYIYSDQEIAELLRACEELKPHENLRPKTYYTLFGLLAATGLRISEALKLKNIDVDLDSALLTVRETKFRKSRLVLMHSSTVQKLHEYLHSREHFCPMPESEAFFLSQKGQRLPYRTVQGTFRKLRQWLKWDRKSKRRPAPRIQDLRHTFTCRRLLKWYEEGVDVNQMIPALSTYLGHVKVSDTYWYLTGIPELFAIGSKKFERFAKKGRGK
jgi:integrase